MNYQWHITDRCDQRCKHCYLFNDKNFKFHEVLLDDAKTIIKKIAKFELKNMVTLTGGDPLLHPNFWDIIEELQKYNITYRILGNPFHLDDITLKKLKDTNCKSYQVSLDGMEKTHDYFRKPGSFKITIDAIKKLNNASIKSVVMTTVSSVNINEVCDILDLVSALNVKAYAFARYVPSGDDVTNGITPMQYKEFLTKFYNKLIQIEQEKDWHNFRFKDHLWKLFFYERNNEKLNTRFSFPLNGCHCGVSHITILPDNSLMACRRCVNSNIGNIITDDISDIWYNKLEEYRNYNNFEKCKDCPLLMYCRGCPAVAMGSNPNKSFYSKDPQCWYNI